MIIKRDTAGDACVSFDAFKVSKHVEHGDVVWRARPLVPWARALINRPEVVGICTANHGWPLKSSGDGFIDITTEPFRAGAGFSLRSDAMDFLRELEEIGAARWRS